MLCTATVVERMDVKGEPNESKRLSLSTTELLSVSEEISKLLKNKDQVHEVNDSYDETIIDLERQVEVLTNKLASCKERTQNELNYFNLTLDNRDQEIQQMQEVQLHKESEMKGLKKKLQDQENDLDEKDNLLNRYQREIGDLKEELEKQSKKLKTLKAEKEKFVKGTEENCEEKANRVVSFNDNVAVKMFEVEDPTEALQKEVNRMKNENEKLKTKLDELKWQMKAKDIMISNSEDTVEMMEDQNEQIEMLQERVDELEEQLRTRPETCNEINNNTVTDIELQLWKDKVNELESKLKDQGNVLMLQNKLTPLVTSPRSTKKPDPLFKEETIEPKIEETVEESPVTDDQSYEDSRQTEYLKILQDIRDSFYTELELRTQDSSHDNGKETLECVLKDLQYVLGSLRLKLSNVLEESMNENNKEMQRMQSLKRMNTSLKEEIHQKTENYGNTVKSLEVRNAALSKSMVVQQQLNDELSEQMKETERDRAAVVEQMNELKLQMMVRDSEVDRLKNIIEQMKIIKSKSKKPGRKAKKKSNSMGNLLK